MTKRSKPEPKTDAAPFHSPFQSLATLKEQLGDAAPEKAVLPPPPAAPGLGGKIVLQREKKGRGGKTVTRISGLTLSAPALEALAGELKRGLGCGATIEEGDVVLLGDLTDRAAELLRKKGAKKVIVGN